MSKITLSRDDLYRLIIRQVADDGFHDFAQQLARVKALPIEGSIPLHELHSLVNKALNATAKPPAALTGITQGDEQRKAATTLPRYDTRFVATHKDAVLNAVFSADGQLVATSSADSSIKLISVPKMLLHAAAKEEGAASMHGKSQMAGAGYGGSSDLQSDPTKPLLRTYYDHSGPIPALDFHPYEPFLISGGSDCLINFYEHTKPIHRRPYRTIIDPYPVRTMQCHPSGDFLLVGTAHPYIRLYDMQTFVPYVSSDTYTEHHTAPINSVKYSDDGRQYVSTSKDGSIKVWDSVTASCVKTITAAHNGLHVSCAEFSPSGRYILSNGKDGIVRLHDWSSGKCAMQYVSPAGAHPHARRLAARFIEGGDFVVAGDTDEASINIWESRTATFVKKLPGHTKLVRQIGVSHTDELFVSCSDDARARFWIVTGE